MPRHKPCWNLRIEPTRVWGARGERYRVYLDDMLLVESTSPEHDACRLLDSWGIRGWACFWREGRKVWSYKTLIAWAAVRAVAEGESQGVKEAKRGEHPLAAEARLKEEKAFAAMTAGAIERGRLLLAQWEFAT